MFIEQFSKSVAHLGSAGGGFGVEATPPLRNMLPLIVTYIHRYNNFYCVCDDVHRR